MKYVLAIGLSLLAGVLGGVMSQRGPLQHAEDRIVELEERDCSGKGGIGRGLAAAMHGQPMQMVEPEERSTPEPFDHELEEPVDPAAEELAAELNAAGDEVVEELADEVDEVAAELDLLMTAQDLRRNQARAALVEQADPSDGELESFDEAMDSMNEDLMDISQDFVDSVDDIEDVSRREMMVLAADVLDVMIEADEAASQAMPGVDLGDIDDEAVDPFSYIDPSILEVLVELDQ